MANLEVYYQIEIHDKNGKLIKRTRWRKSRSYVIQFLEILYSQFNETDYDTTTTGGVVETIDFDYAASCMAFRAGAGVDVAGVVVGTGTTAPPNEEYALELQISHGTASGQLDHASTSVSTPGVVGANVDLAVSRTLTNPSPAEITVNEIGIYARGVDITPADRDFMIIRDVLPSPEEIPVTKILTVKYTLRTTV